MEIWVESFDGEKYTVEVGVDDTTADLRRKVASATALCKDSFDMSFGGEVLAKGDDTTQLSAGDTIVLTKMKKTTSLKDDAIAALRDLGETRLTEDRFKGLTDPMLVHLFLQAEVVTELRIPNLFLSSGRFEELDLSGASVVTQLGNNFLYDCTSLHTADLSGWRNVRRIEFSFLFGCSALRSLDLSGWLNVTHIGNFFLQGCISLTTLDISGWNNVTRIEYSFLRNCTSLRTLDLSGWHNVTHIGGTFLCNCVSLATLDLSGWTSVMRIEPGFLKGCKIHKSSINLTGSSNVMSEYVHGVNTCPCVCM